MSSTSGHPGSQQVMKKCVEKHAGEQEKLCISLNSQSFISPQKDVSIFTWLMFIETIQFRVCQTAQQSLKGWGLFLPLLPRVFYVLTPYPFTPTTQATAFSLTWRAARQIYIGTKESVNIRKEFNSRNFDNRLNNFRIHLLCKFTYSAFCRLMPLIWLHLSFLSSDESGSNFKQD